MAKAPRFCVDPKSYELAEHFLEDHASESRKRELAQCIQDAVEDWCEVNPE